MRLHSAVGGRLGISEVEIEKLATLDRDSFDYREWLVLKFARDRTDAGGRDPGGAYAGDYRRLYTSRERKYHLKLLRMMRFANLLNNTIHGRPWRATLPGFGDSCPIDAREPHGGDGSK
ncbi:MAG: hypothetical protein E4G96_10245 [Chrysiogenales bacterium]|nr:MAG: hypothetical protein E4G96_10245 [Chrysiogenales bacterium]